MIVPQNCPRKPLKNMRWLLAAILIVSVHAPAQSVAAEPDRASKSQRSGIHIGIVILENISYSSVIGNNLAPYMNRLAKQFGLATNMYANTHPSMGNYFMMTTGQIVSNDDAFMGAVSDDNLVRELAAAGKTWKVYAQSLPSVGYTGGDNGYYVKHHNPFAYLSDVVHTSQANNIVPLAQLEADLSAGALPDFFFIIPDNAHNGHDCPNGMPFCPQEYRMQLADAWLKTLDPLLNSTAFHNGLLIITFDEGDFSDSAKGGGHIATVFAGDAVKRRFRLNAFVQHEHLLRFVCDALVLRTCPGSASTASNALQAILQHP